MTDKTYALPAIPICPGCRCALAQVQRMEIYICWSDDCPFSEMPFEAFNLLRIMQWMDGEGPCQPIRDDAEFESTTIGKLSALLDQIAVILKGPNPEMGLHSFHDLPELVRQLKGRLHQDD